MLYIRAAAVHMQSGNQNHFSKRHALDSYAAFLLQERKTLHRSVCENHLSTFDGFLLTEIAQTKSASLPVKTMYTYTMSRFSFDVATKKRLLTARAKLRAQRPLRTVTKRTALGKKQAGLRPVAEKTARLLLPGSSVISVCVVAKFPLAFALCWPPHHLRRYALQLPIRPQASLLW